MNVDPLQPQVHTLFSPTEGKPEGMETSLLPAESVQSLLDFVLERSYLDGLSAVENFGHPSDVPPLPLGWVHLQRLPIHPSRIEEYDLLARWQSLLGTLHAWQNRLVFLLIRSQGQTHIYLGAENQSGYKDATTAATQLAQATLSQMPGIELKSLGAKDVVEQIHVPLTYLQSAGAVTGLPSPRKTRSADLLQTLDQIAFGVRDRSNHESDYAIVAAADPVPDYQIATLIQSLRAIGSQVHSFAKRTTAAGGTITHGMQNSLDVGALVADLVKQVPFAGPFLNVLAIHSKVGIARTGQEAQTHNVSVEQIDKLAQYCETLIDCHVARLQQGRNFGFWSAAVYVLAETETTVHTLAGMLRSIYSGDQSYLEPIRVHLLHPRSHAVEWIHQFRRLPLPREASETESGEQLTGQAATGWHPLGPLYEGVSTPLNTEELSIITSLPRRDVPGLRFVRNAVRFATNPPPLISNANMIPLGRVMDTGVTLSVDYAFDVNTLVRHGMVTGITGSGKSTTCRRLITEVVSRGLPVLVIEPAKDEYIRWAIEYNKTKPEEQQLQIFVPGIAEIGGVAVQPLRLNPFQPATIGDTIDLASRYERFCTVLTASLPMADVLPLLLEEAIYKYLQHTIDVHFADSDVSVRERYPKLEGLITIARRVIDGRGYEPRVKDNLIAAVETRINALTRGKRGSILNTEQSTPFKDLFERSAVINLSYITDDRDKALIMAMLITALFEYRSSMYRTNSEYKQRADENRLCHLTIIEEAHRLLANPERDYTGVGNPQAVVSDMFSEMLSEIRAYGQGLLVVDQVPSRLIPDAIKNTNLKIVHRLVARDDRAAMSSCMALRPDQEDIIAALRVGEAIVCSDYDDAASWVSVRE